MLLVAVCDDLPKDRLYIKSLICDYCNRMKYEIHISEFENGEALENYYLNQETFFDIIFLDIYMNGKNGILTAKQIRKYDLDCKIIFTTTSTKHALESFEVFPYNYLTKPLSKSTFFPVFEKAIDATQKEKQKSLSIKVGASLQKLFLKDILFIESAARTLSIHTIHAKIYSTVLKLDEIQKQIDDPRFIRCHQSFLVNMDYISSVENYSFKLVNGQAITIVQRNFAGNKKIFYDYLLNKVNLKHSFKKEEE